MPAREKQCAPQNELLLRTLHLLELALRVDCGVVLDFPEGCSKPRGFSVYGVGPVSAIRERFNLEFRVWDKCSFGACIRGRTRFLASLCGVNDFGSTCCHKRHRRYASNQFVTNLPPLAAWALAKLYCQHFLALHGCLRTECNPPLPYIGLSGWSRSGKRLHNAATPAVHTFGESPEVLTRASSGSH